MSLQSRVAICDICGESLEEKSFGVGFPGWTIVQGIGARAPEPDESISNVHLEMYICTEHKPELITVLDELQERYK